MKLFDLDSPFMQALGKVADLMWLNILTLFCCIPVITVGASLTALHYMALKIVRGEECYISRGYFKSFKENFRQATIIWLMLVAVAAVLILDLYIVNHTEGAIYGFVRLAILAVSVFLIMTAICVFPLLAKFSNTIRQTIKNAFMMSVLQLPKTVAMAVLYAVPLFIMIYVFQLFPMVLMFGASVPAFLSALMYNKFFQKLEDRIMEENGGEDAGQTEDGEDERIFRDELDPTLAKDD